MILAIRLGIQTRDKALLRATVVVLLMLLSAWLPVPGDADTLQESITPPLEVDAAVPFGSTNTVKTPHALIQGNPYRIVVSGSFKVTDPNSGRVLEADAECAGVHNSPDRYHNLGAHTYPVTASAIDDLDLLVNGNAITWKPYVSATAADSDPTKLRPELKCASPGDPDRAYYFDWISPRNDRVAFSVTNTLHGGMSSNEGSLFVRVLCVRPAGYFGGAGVNRAEDELAFGSAGCPQGEISNNAGHVCGKSPTALPNPTRPDAHGVLEAATLTVDSRTNKSDKFTSSSGYHKTYTSEDYWKESGHWGVHTCNVAAPGIPYRVVVRGSYSYDRLQLQDGLSEQWGQPVPTTADAECSTGFPRASGVLRKDHEGKDFKRPASPPSESLVKQAADNISTPQSFASPWASYATATVGSQLGLQTPTQTVAWDDLLVPWYYRYFIEGLRKGRLTTPEQFQAAESVFPATRGFLTELLSATAISGHVQIASSFDEYKPGWDPHRFDYSITTTSSSGSIIRRIDPLDLVVGFGTQEPRLVEWTPLEQTTPGVWATTAQGESCSGEHTYYYDFYAPSNSRFRFKIFDLLDYNEWDNCGGLAIKVQAFPEDGVFSVPEPNEISDCQWLPEKAGREVNIRDLQFDDSNPANLANSHAYYFHPEDLLVASVVTGDVPIITFRNQGNGPHSMTAAVRTNGDFCTDVLTSDEVRKALGASTVPKAIDDCDKNPGQHPRLFDSHPQCLGFGLSGFCMPPNSADAVAQASWSWPDPKNKDPKNPDGKERLQSFLTTESNPHCKEGYCVIPYFCRIAPDTMRGNIIVRIRAS